MLSIASFTLASSYAGAAGKYTKKESEITATQTALTKPVQKAKDEKKRPTITADDVFGGVGEKVKSITDVQIKKYKRLIDVTNDTDPEKPDLLFRMAELYNEQYRYYDFRARELDEKIFDAGNAQQHGAGQPAQGPAGRLSEEVAAVAAGVGQGVSRGRRPPGQVRLVQAYGRGPLLPGVHAQPGEEGRCGA